MDKVLPSIEHLHTHMVPALISFIPRSIQEIGA